MSSEDSVEQVEVITTEEDNGEEVINSPEVQETVTEVPVDNSRTFIIPNRYNLFSAIEGGCLSLNIDSLDEASMHINAHVESKCLLLEWDRTIPENNELALIVLELADNRVPHHFTALQTIIRRLVVLCNERKLKIHSNPMILW